MMIRLVAMMNSIEFIRYRTQLIYHNRFPSGIARLPRALLRDPLLLPARAAGDFR